ALSTEATRVRRHGFTETDLARQKQETLRAYRQAYSERETTNSASFAQEYVSHFLENEPSPGIAFEYETVQILLPGVTLEEVNQLAADLLQEENRAVIVRLPQKEGITPPTEAQLRSTLESIDNREIEAYVDAIEDQPLISHELVPGEVVATHVVEQLGVTEISLSNGIRIVMKPTDFKDDELQMSAFSPGGSSLVADREAFEMETSSQLIARSGIGSFDRTALEKALAGKVVSVSPYVSEIEEGFSGSASPEDLETLFQLINLYFTSPRADQNALAALQNEMRSSLVNRSANPFAVYQDSLTAALYGRNVRRMAPSIQMVDELDLTESLDHYRDRFADASDFTFIFAGDFSVDTLTTLAQMYLGSLPTHARTESWRDVSPPLPDDVVRTDVHKGIGEQSWVALVFNGPFDFNRKNRHHLRSLSEALAIILRRDLREDRGGVYNVGVNANTSAHPDSTYTFFVNFGCAPDRVDELRNSVFEQIEKIKTDGPDDEVVATVQEQQRRERETQVRTNGFWLNVLDFHYTHNEDVLDILTYEDQINDLTAEDIRNAAQKYLDTDRYVEAVLYPESTGSGN
ncbi:MAG: insulinase family protein, partial [Rhodothermales bacterium]